MSTKKENSATPSTRRRFLGESGTILAGGALAGVAIPHVHAGEDNTIKIAAVGCGGRGSGAMANALSTEGPTRLVAMADVFEDRLETSYQSISKKFGDQVDVPQDRKFLGLEGYKQAIDAVAPGGLVILATPPAFRPIHVEYAVQKGCNVFMEKSFAVDAPGIRRILAAGQEAEKKNLKVAGGLMSRHYPPLQQAVEQIHNGAIGEVITCWAYREHHAVGFRPRQPDASEFAHQIRNYSCFTWCNGSFFLDWLIHNLDVCCWTRDKWPVSAQGQGGRQERKAQDQLFDHYAIEYTFPGGTRLFAQGRHMPKCWGFFGDVIHGTTGCAVIGEGIKQPRIYKGHEPTDANLIWQYKDKETPDNPYQVEHDMLFAAIRENKPYNEAERSAYAAMVGILGRMAAESGQEIKWEDAMASDLELAPGLDKVTSLDAPAPVLADKDGNYSIAMPGETVVL